MRTSKIQDTSAVEHCKKKAKSANARAKIVKSRKSYPCTCTLIKDTAQTLIKGSAHTLIKGTAHTLIKSSANTFMMKILRLTNN